MKILTPEQEAALDAALNEYSIALGQGGALDPYTKYAIIRALGFTPTTAPDGTLPPDIIPNSSPTTTRTFIPITALAKSPLHTYFAQFNQTRRGRKHTSRRYHMTSKKHYRPLIPYWRMKH